MKSNGFRFWIACVSTECGNALPDKNGISNGLSVDPMRAVLCRGRLRLKRIIRRTNPGLDAGYPIDQRTMPAKRQGRHQRHGGVGAYLTIPEVSQDPKGSPKRPTPR